MCTAITYKNTYFGRTLDIECSYGEQVCITPRRFSLELRRMGRLEEHHAIIGMAAVVDGYPLYFDAANEKGLAMAGLNFPQSAHYPEPVANRDNVSPFEFIPWVLSQCGSLGEARELLARINLCRIDFSKALPLSPLHWLIADRDGAIVVEPTQDGLKVYENPIGVLTNEPPFEYQMLRLSDHMGLSCLPLQDALGIGMPPYSRGMGAMGLPGDLSSTSRFVRVAFTKLNSISEDGDDSISQFFHILGAVNQTRGCVRLPDGKLEMTAYTSCIDIARGVYYYTTYENSRISAIDMHRCELDGTRLFVFDLIRHEDILYSN